MGISERKARQKESLRQEILDAAREILLSEGFKNFSMRHIAARIEYTPTTLYHYFKDKNDILFHLCEEVYGKITEILQSTGAKEKDPIARLRAAMRAFIKFGLSHPDRYRIAFMTNVTPNVDPMSFLKPGTMSMNAYEMVRQRVRDALNTQTDSSADVESLSQAVWASTHGLTSLLISCPDFPWVERKKLIETSIDLWLRGLTGSSAKIAAPPERIKQI